MNCYKIKIDYDFPNSDSKREFLFRGLSLDISCISCKKDISKIMNQFEYIKKVDNVKRTILSGGGYFIFEALCNKNLTLEELKEFIEKLKRAGFSSKSNVNVVFYNVNNYIYKISFETGKVVPNEKYDSKRESIYEHAAIYVKKPKAKKVKVQVKSKETKSKVNNPSKVQKCNSCGGKGVGLVSENGFCEHCNRTKQLYSCSVCNKQFSTNSGKDMHFKMKHKFVETENPLSQVLESLQAPISDVEKQIYHIEKQSQLAQVEEEFVSLLSIPDFEKPIYHIDTSGLCHMGSLEPLTDYLITLFIVMYWKKHRLIVREFYMVNIVQILCLKYLHH